MSTFEQAERREAHKQAQSVLRAGVPADENGDRDCRTCKHYGHSGDYMDHGFCDHPHARKLSAHEVSPSYMHSLALCTNRAAHLWEGEMYERPKSQEGAGVILKPRPPQTNAQDAVNVGFAEIAIEHLAQGDEDDEFYGLSEAGCVNGGYAMVELVEKHYVSREEHDRRVTELLEANNRTLEQRRALRSCMEWAMQLIPESLSGVNQEMRKTIRRLFR